MPLSQKRRFTFTWQIQNFSMCPQKFHEVLKSPVFLVKMLESSEWQLELYPKGSDEENAVSCYLRCTSVGSSTDSIETGFTLSIFSNDVAKRVSKQVNNHSFKKDTGWGFPSLISNDAIWSDEEAYLPNNTLAIKCSIWRSKESEGEKDSFKSGRKNEDLANIMKYSVQDSALWDKCTVVTRVEVQRKNIFWPIGNFSSIDFSERLVMCIPSVLRNVPPLFITLSKSRTDRSVQIQIRKGPDSSEDTFVNCKVSVPYTSKGVDIFAEDDHTFESHVEDIWKFPTFIKLNTLEEDKYFYRTCDVLHLHLEFSFSQLEGIHHTENVFMRLNETLKNISYPIIEEFRRLYKDKELSDVTIRIADQEFNVHRIILKARSPVFNAMFDNNMKEKETGVVHITDVDPDTMDRMLVFMYTNTIGDMVVEDALKLYSAADKYQVLPLKVRCAWILASGLSVSHVCEVLVLADQHNDEYLRDCAEGFIEGNSIDIFKSQEWEILMQNYGTVAAKVMHKMLTI